MNKENVKQDFSPSIHLSMNFRLDTELPSDKVSITNIMERLDLETMLMRAQQGILDLRAFQRPMEADIVGTGATPAEIEHATRSLLDMPDSPTSRVFGVDKETATQALKDLHSLADRYKVTKTEETPQGDSKDVKDEEKTPKVDPA